jgi:hypothetical protein
MPNPNTLSASVFRVRDLSEEQIWNIGEDHVAEPRGKVLYGRADLNVNDVTSQGLKLDPDNNPPRHANIVGWPPEKDRQLLLAQELAHASFLTIR